MTEFSRAFRDAVARRYKGGPSVAACLIDSLRELARNHLAEVLDAGGTVEGAARDLGVHSSKLLAWQRVREAKQVAAPPAKPLLPVQLAPTPGPSATTPRFVVRTPSGVVVECAYAQDVAELLIMRCLG